MMCMPEWLSHRASLSPHRLALVCGPQQITFTQLEERVAVLAERLSERGVRPEDRVAVLCRNGLPYAELVHAVPRLGAVLVPLNTRLTPDELRHQLRDVGAKMLVHDATHAEVTHQIGSWYAGAICASVEDLAASAMEAPPSKPAPVNLSRLHSIIYSSGTTGRPKGVQLTHGNFWFNAAGSALNLGHSPDDRWLSVLPLFHVGGLSILLRSAIYGITAIVHERFDPVAVNQAIDEEGVTIVSVVSAMLQRMLAERGDRPYPSSLRCVLLGGGPASRQLLQRCAALEVPVAQTYGLTETASQVATLAPDEALHRIGSAGKPLMTAEIRIEQDGRPVPAGSEGEILVRGPIVTPGYVNQPEATALAIREGWLHTGDIGHLDKDGYLYVLDRRADLIISGGENIYPAEVEAVLASHPAVAEAGVFGMPDSLWGQTVAAAIVPAVPNPPLEDEILAFCKDRLAAYKIPRRIAWIGSLPRNAGGKLLRRSLADLLPEQ